jgi:hypothetical protein
MATPGFLAEAALYKSTTHYRSALPNTESVGRMIPIVKQLTSQDQLCSTATVTQCLTDAENVLQNEQDACNDLGTLQQRERCRTAARREYTAAIANCDPCPVGTRCESNVCCPNDRPTCAPPCVYGDDQATSTGEVNLVSGALLYNSKSTYDKRTQTASNRILVSQGKDSLITIEHGRSSSGGVTTSVDYGPMFTGVQHASFSSSDGVTFVGSIDGRQTVSYAANTDPRTITFVDGGALPALGSNVPGLLDSLNTLAQTVQSSVPLVCRPAARPTAQLPARALSFQPTIVPAYHIRFGGPASAACATCTNDAAETLAECLASAATLVGLSCFFPPACPIAAAAGGAAVGLCETQFGYRMAKCELTPCCPKRCGPSNLFDPGSGCCDDGEQCVDQSDPNAREGCCPVGRSVCSGNCCRDGETCVQGVCCPPGARSVCNGVCCSGDCDRVGNCCNPPSQLCRDGTCCAPFGQTCHPTLGTCCSVICGPSCCANGQFCQDPVGGICGSCDPGYHACLNPKGVPPCCPDRTDCCANGQCCPIDPTAENPEGTCCCATQTGWECRPRSDKCCTPR